MMNDVLTHAEHEAVNTVKKLIGVKLYPSWRERDSRPTVLFVSSGDFRCPKKGEYYLSGAIPEVYRASNDLPSKYHVMRVATERETHCLACEQPLPIERG